MRFWHTHLVTQSLKIKMILMYLRHGIVSTLFHNTGGSDLKVVGRLVSVGCIQGGSLILLLMKQLQV